MRHGLINFILNLPNLLLSYVNVASNVPSKWQVHVTLEKTVCFTYKGVRFWRDYCISHVTVDGMTFLTQFLQRV